VHRLTAAARNASEQNLSQRITLQGPADSIRTATTATLLDEAPVTGDGVLLERLIANLLDNAERYNIPDGTVTISTSSHDGASLAPYNRGRSGRGRRTVGR
jgi:signal transduction histidine kinase